ncbi:MAG: serine/threonine-protein phosphatase [Planctomycetales bacterium]|nr:serine/threonine-protein phosphatase [Planctomycetales bacterium]
MPPANPTSFRLEHAVLSDIGMRRANNQDSVVAVINEGSTVGRGGLFMVADGMGAHAAGELASKLAVDNVPHSYRQQKDQSPPMALRKAVQEANLLIHNKGQSSPEFHGMGTTCTSLLAIGNAALVAHVGDSRVYRVRGDELQQLTFDHSLVWEIAEAHDTTEDNVPACIPKNVITRSLGPHPVVNVDLEGPFDLQEGDAFVMCSDGLTGVVENEVIGAVLASMPPQEAAQTLIDLANLGGGPDNISVVAIRVGKASETPGAEPPTRLTPQGTRWALVASFVCLAAVIWCIAEQFVWGAVLSAVGLGASVARVFARDSHRQVGSLATLGGPYGSAPYRRVACGPGPETTGAIREVLDELSKLREKTTQLNGAANIDWTGFDRTVKEAEATGDWRQQVCGYGQALRGLMKQVRESPRLREKALDPKSGSSVIE